MDCPQFTPEQWIRLVDALGVPAVTPGRSGFVADIMRNSAEAVVEAAEAMSRRSRDPRIERLRHNNAKLALRLNAAQHENAWLKQAFAAANVTINTIIKLHLPRE